MYGMFRSDRYLTTMRPLDWIWKSLVAGLCGMIAHSLLMFLKTRLGLLPEFKPYEAFQAALGQLVGSAVSPVVPWLLSFLNGSAILGLFCGSIFRLLPGIGGVTKGTVVGLLGWLIMGLVFFPLLGLGLFASKLAIGFGPALFSLAMMLTYSVVLGVVYSALNSYA